MTPCQQVELYVATLELNLKTAREWRTPKMTGLDGKLVSCPCASEMQGVLDNIQVDLRRAIGEGYKLLRLTSEHERGHL